MVDVLLGSTYEDQKREFVFDFKDSGKHQRLTVPIPIPLKIGAKEFVLRLISFHNLPCYLEPGKKILDFFQCTSNASVLNPGGGGTGTGMGWGI